MQLKTLNPIDHPSGTVVLLVQYLRNNSPSFEHEIIQWSPSGKVVELHKLDTSIVYWTANLNILVNVVHVEEEPPTIIVQIPETELKHLHEERSVLQMKLKVSEKRCKKLEKKLKKFINNL